MRLHRLAPVLLLGGCTVFGDGPFAGTWLFTYDLNPSYSGDCGEDEVDVIYTGDGNSLADIYTTSGDQVVVLLEEILTGPIDGRSFTATWDYTYADDSYTEAKKYKLTGELSGGVLSGSFRYDEAQQVDDETWTCTITTDYEARKIVSDRDDYLEN